MKYFSSFTTPAAVMAVVLLFTACSKKSDPVPTSTPIWGMTWVMDGNAAKTTNVSTSAYYNTGSNTSEFVGLFAGVFSDNSGLTIVLPAPLTVGTYPVVRNTSYQTGVASVSYGMDTSSGIPARFVGTSGTVTVTRLTDKSVIGTFTFSAQCTSSSCVAGSTRSFTAGTFILSR